MGLEILLEIPKNEKYSIIISKMTHIEFMLFLFSGVIPNSLISVASGVAKMSFKKFIM